KRHPHHVAHGRHPMRGHLSAVRLGGPTFNADVTIHNTGTTAVDRWELSFHFPGDQAITQIWNATRTRDGRSVTVTHPTDYNTSIAPRSSVNFGFSGTSQTGTNGAPATFTLNGTACTSA
ncbi:cellulose binding domain-containing protein, partial [Streptomyces parvus]|uniref:cellulose binding domain-containing protein n=1 Tax=Streptomyces parvus TaxID=66428 RepID=UPI001AD65964